MRDDGFVQARQPTCQIVSKTICRIIEVILPCKNLKRNQRKRRTKGLEIAQKTFLKIFEIQQRGGAAAPMAPPGYVPGGGHRIFT